MSELVDLPFIAKIIHSFDFNSSDSKARFKLFKKGSGLEVIEEEMATSVEIQKSIEIELQRRKEVGWKSGSGGEQS